MAKKRSLRQRGRIEQNTFVRGLITEANPLTYPENASLEEENFVLNRDGSRQRRLGVDFEANSASTLISYTEGDNTDIEHFLWKNAGNIQNRDISVLKVGSRFYFFDNNAESVSSSPLNGGSYMDVAGFDPTGGGNPVIYSYAFINGKMAIVSGFQYITLLSYDEFTDVVSKETKHLACRDTFGIYDDRPIDDRPLFATTTNDFENYLFTDFDASGIHIYNLANQGWQDKFKFIGRLAGGAFVEDTIAVTFTLTNEGGSAGIGVMPSNSDTLWANTDIAPINPENIGMYYPQRLLQPFPGTRRAPKGHIVFDNMFVRGQTRANTVIGRSGTGGVDQGTAVGSALLLAPYSQERTEGGLSAIEAHGGRLFFSVYENGITASDNASPSFGDMVFFSQATDGVDGLTKCHTELNPTDAENFALLATDGGYITLSGVGTINALKSLGNSVFVFADNGVWQINGGSTIFTASNISVDKITNVGNINRKGIVVAENTLYYQTDAGLYEVRLSENDPSLPATVTNLSQGTIQAFFDDLSVTAKQHSVAQFDRYSRSVKWLFSRETLLDRSYFDTELVLDLNLNAFYINAFASVDADDGIQTPYVIGYLERPTAIITDTSDAVTVLGVAVTVTGLPVEITYRSIDSSVLTSNKYWTARYNSAINQNFSVAEQKDLQFRDWATHLNTAGGFGEDAFAYMLTGYLTGGDSTSFKRNTYITSHFRRTERIFTPVADGFEPDNPSSCLLTAQWEWTSHADAGRWSNPQQVYRLPRTFIPDTGIFNYGFEVVTTKTKLRGKGRALSLLFQSEPLKDCHLYGWSYELNAEVSV